MTVFNGKGPGYCKYCGGEEGIHRGSDMACPANGVDQTGSQNPRYLDWAKFDPQESESEIEKKAVESKGLFDEYFMAILPSISLAFYKNHLMPEAMDDFRESMVEHAFELTLVAMKKRDAYFQSLYDKAVGK